MVQGVQRRCRWCREGAGEVQVVQGGCRLPAPSAPQQAQYPVQGGAGGAGTPQGLKWHMPDGREVSALWGKNTNPDGSLKKKIKCQVQVRPGIGIELGRGRAD